MAKAKQSEESSKRDAIREDHNRLKANVAAAKDNRAFVLECITDSRFAKILKRYEDDIEQQKEKLIVAEKKEIDGLQASVMARRQLICTLKASYESDLQDAQHALSEFERNNELFIHANVDKQTGEIREAAAGE